MAVMLAAMVVAMVVVVDGWGYNDVWGDVVLDVDSMVSMRRGLHHWGQAAIL
jgi:hypothetical protein